MTFETGKTYTDAIGRKWTVKSKALVKETLVLLVSCPRFHHGIWIQHALAIVEDDMPDRATVLLDDGFTTIYEEDEE